jgi:tetratricopeptide (TPR) repeat protein
MMKLKKTLVGAFLSGVAFVGVSGAAGLVLAWPSAAMAQEGEGEGEGEEGSGRKRAESLDPANAKVLQEVFELTSAKPPQYQTALGKLNQLIDTRGGGMKPFDKSSVYEFRASVKYQLEDYRGALRDFEQALAAGGFDNKRNNQIRYYIAQLNMQLENYPEAIRGLNEWIAQAKRDGVTVDANAYYLLAAAYVSSTPPNYRAAMNPAENAIAARTEPKKSDYDLLNLIYSETNEPAKRGPLLEKMVNNWPGERSYWVQLSGYYSQTGKDAEAFAVIEVAYRAGLLSKESDILTLVNFYSFFDNPYRGAKLLEREMETGNVAKNTKNLTLLSQLWSQAREHKRAIPVLRQAAGGAPNGELYYRLGQVLLADEQYVESERALQSALSRGGLAAEKVGDIYMLLGTARFSQAGPGDCGKRSSARAAFVSATRYPKSSKQARDWVGYIDAINRTEEDQNRLERQQLEEQRLADISRLRQATQVCRLQGGSNCATVEARLKELETAGPVKAKASCLSGGGEPAEGGEAAPAEGETTAAAPAAEGAAKPAGAQAKPKGATAQQPAPKKN